ncbi:MAG: hypothetical protein NC548_33990 [Lachnospiraceae bacterium]|nr:hypothetical protein [Lachnospiraceae bacterium]
MYIAPNTTIKLLSGVPLDPEYEHTIFFIQSGAQEGYFYGKAKHTLNNTTYQRVGSGVLRVGILADNLYDCNYLMFQNTSFGNKWFYAFITSVEYVSNQVSEVRYEIDVLQTWLFDYTQDYCFIERCHTPTDNIGEHIEPEPVATGEYVFNDYSVVTDLTEFYILMQIVDASSGISGTRYDQVYSGATLWCFEPNDISGMDAKLQSFVDSPDSVISMYCVPKPFIDQAVTSGGTELRPTSAFRLVISSNPPSASMDLDGYKPNNCKLYTYPYNFWSIQNGSGSNLAIRYELCYQNRGLANIIGTITPNVQAALYPIGYKGSGAGKMYMGESLGVGQFPQCAWNTDSYKAWLAQNSIPIGINAGASALQAGIGIMSGSPISMVSGTSSAISQISTVMSQAYSASIAADVTRGAFNNGNALSANNLNTFVHGRMSVNQYYAQMIDGFFDMYGYAVRKVDKPMRNARPEWTYIKTATCNLSGSVPGDDMRKIIQIYNSGITWWINGNNVGNYNLNNKATTRG